MTQLELFGELAAAPSAAGPVPEAAGDDAAGDLADGFAHAAAAIARSSGAPAQRLALVRAAARFASLAVARGDSCASFGELAAALAVAPDALRRELIDSGAVGLPQRRPPAPMVLDGERLYLHRYFDLERRLARQLARRAAPAPAAADPALLRAMLERVFDRARAAPPDGADWQKIAAALALRNKLTIVSGGPGTGKTTTVVAMLACLVAAQPRARIGLAAPTGKAAARMQDAVRRQAQSLPPQIAERLPAESHTVHRLLGVLPDGRRFRHGPDNRLPLDALVVDEASMLDLALATRLLEALPDDARLILLGDRDQLAAVEAGAVFAELCASPALSLDCARALAAATGIDAQAIETHAAAAPPADARPALEDRVVLLTHSYRFGRQSGIGRLAADVNAGRGAEALDAIAAGQLESVDWIDDGGARLQPATLQRLCDGYAGFVSALAAGAAAPEAFAAFDGYRVLCAMRDGARGVAAINALIDRHVRAALNRPPPAGDADVWYVGRPVIVHRNDYLLRVFNGDIGICLPDDAGEMRVWFAAPAGGFRAVSPVRLPEHETAYAMTVHKSQGSEFRSVALVLPDRPSRVATRELVYTGITRAIERVALIAGRDAFCAACASPTRRVSGLTERLRESARAPA
ncbi:MAG TPA: exodeoxyribonuclease V subunit alpha [Burkholderiaceae bacterium]|nr:exodeoxyribonuclease V subunit alpha [Burkholderiaceae bacterium]